MNNTEEARRYWQNWDKGEAAKRIDEYWIQSESDWRSILTADIQAEFGRKATILEVGCGSGLIYQTMLRRRVVTPTSYIGGDVSQSMLAIARHRFPGIQFVDLDVFNLRYPNRSQPNVICVHVLQHLPYYDQAMRELMRITDKKLYIVSWFTPGSEDELVFSDPSDNWDGQAFQNNCYSLSKFLMYVITTSDRTIHELRVRHFGGQNYSISVCFDGQPANSPLPIISKSLSVRVKRNLKKLLGR